MIAKSVRAWSTWRRAKGCFFGMRTSCQNVVDRPLTLMETGNFDAW
jgi:hypothetical protein